MVTEADAACVEIYKRNILIVRLAESAHERFNVNELKCGIEILRD